MTNPRLQERLESRPVGQALISGLIVVTLVAVFVANLPDSRLRRDASEVTRAYLYATGLDQTWSLFAPRPRQTSLRLEARVRYEDGSIALWRPPVGGDLVGGYRDYRWRKWLENATRDERREVLWRPAALFAAREMRRPGKVPRSVTLVRRWQELRPPGAVGPDRRPWKRYAYYTLPASELGRR